MRLACCYPQRDGVPDTESNTLAVKAALAIRRLATDRHALEVMKRRRRRWTGALRASPLRVPLGQESGDIA
jgi:hypothetical protein